MLKYFFALIILMHGLIHFMGFAKAFGYGNITQITKEVSKPEGFFWLLTAFIFIVATILFLLKKDAWIIISIIAVIISQILFILAWKDAKFGTIANIIILVIAIIAAADIRFNKTIKKEVRTLLSNAVIDRAIITEQMLNGFPPIVHKWLINSGIVGKQKISIVRLKQTGEMITKPGGKWKPFIAKQYFTIDTPAFNWQVKAKIIPLLTLAGRDKFENGEGEMLIKASPLITIVNEGHNTKMNESTMLRYLAEISWFPSAVLTRYIKWEPVDSVSAKATMIYKDLKVSGIFHFSNSGDILSFEGNRFYKKGKQESMEKWFIENRDHKEFNGIRIPTKSKVIWKLKEGDFHWLNLEITAIEFNIPELYQ
jgi:hypothetical protein